MELGTASRLRLYSGSKNGSRYTNFGCTSWVCNQLYLKLDAPDEYLLSVGDRTHKSSQFRLSKDNYPNGRYKLEFRA